MNDILIAVTVASVFGVLTALALGRVLASSVLKEYFDRKSKYIQQVDDLEEGYDGCRLEESSAAEVQGQTEGGTVQAAGGRERNSHPAPQKQEG